jgi:hypothetical protein
LSQIKRTPGLFVCQTEGFELTLGLSYGDQIHDRQHYSKTRSYDLDGLAVDNREGGAQGLMAPYKLVEAVLQSSYVEPANKLKRARNIVKGITRLPLMEEPHPLLGKRRGKDEAFLFHTAIVIQTVSPLIAKGASNSHKDIFVL